MDNVDSPGTVVRRDVRVPADLVKIARKALFNDSSRIVIDILWRERAAVAPIISIVDCQCTRLYVLVGDISLCGSLKCRLGGNLSTYAGPPLPAFLALYSLERRS
jgi:hypothetical protein